MKSGTVNFKDEFQHSVNRHKVSNRIVNGGDSAVPLSAAQRTGPLLRTTTTFFRVQKIKCAIGRKKSDPIYASERGDPPADTSKESRLRDMQLRDMVISHLDIITQLQEELERKSRQVCNLLDGNKKLAARVARSDRRMCLLRGQERVPPFLATRYFGRKSKTIPSRALKRRYMGPPKNFHLRKPGGARPSGATHAAGAEPELKKKKRRRKKDPLPNYLTTDEVYFLPDPCPEVAPAAPRIDVPLWKLKPVTSFYQMEGTENINDSVFERRHQKHELDERRRKRWDLQRLREQRAKTEKLRQKRERGERSNPVSFLPDYRQMLAIEVSELLPVVAFGHPIPIFEPCEFSLPWTPVERNCLLKKRGRGRPSSTVT